MDISKLLSYLGLDLGSNFTIFLVLISFSKVGVKRDRTSVIIIMFFWWLPPKRCTTLGHLICLGLTSYRLCWGSIGCSACRIIGGPGVLGCVSPISLHGRGRVPLVAPPPPRPAAKSGLRDWSQLTGGAGARHWTPGIRGDQHEEEALIIQIRDHHDQSVQAF